MDKHVTGGALLARRCADRYRITGYGEVRSKATQVASQILEVHGNNPDSLVIVPILFGGGPPARLVVDALLGFGVIHEVVPCRIKRYAGVGKPGLVGFTLPLRTQDIADRIVVGIDDMVDGGETMMAFVEHALQAGARTVETAVIYSKPQSRFVPDYCAESGVTEWLVMPGEELDFMNNISRSDEQVKQLSAIEMGRFFIGLGIEAQIVEDWQNLAARLESRRGVQ
jgi:hypoxanthine phosphoribosyltransferase